MKSKILALLGSTLLTGTAMAGGYQVNLASQRQIGMGHTGTGLVTGTSSIFFNPGAMAQARNGITIGASAIVSKIAYQAPDYSETAADNPTGTPFQVYGVYGINDKIKVGLGVYTPFGSTVNWGSEWYGRKGLNELSLKAIYIQPTISYQVTDKLGIGAGVTYTIGSVNLQRTLPIEGEGGAEAGIELDGDAKSAFGYNLGIFFQPTDKLSLGLSYRSKVDVEVEEGDVTYSNLENLSASARTNFPDGAQFAATLPLPSTLSFGIGYNATEKLTLAVDISRVGWSEYEELRFDFTKPVGGNTTSASARNYEDTYIYRIGAEYKVTDALALRAGAYYDETPVQDGYLTPETPDADSRGLSVGLGYSINENISIDASFLYINKKERTDEANLSNGVPGTFKSIAYIPGFALNYNF
ncbi:OmpP1/FadL family transporter [Pontibacter populi]|uniref:OmpP1/FadL family transporter n=1 Tax=Pontibacter populi TaxID=890055 RepID=A0ABV1RX55_9BACT